MAEKIARIRTIKSVILYLKEKDPDNCVSEWWLRQLVNQRKIKFHKAGAKILIDLDALEEFLKNPPVEDDNEVLNYGKLRKIQG